MVCSIKHFNDTTLIYRIGIRTLATCYFDNCIYHQNCNCDMVLRDDARLVRVTAIYGQCGQCSPCEVQQQLKFTLSTKILATDWPL